MALIPSTNLVTNGTNPGNTTGWTTSGTVTISSNRFRLAAGASLQQVITPTTLPSKLLIEVQGSMENLDVPGGVFGQLHIVTEGSQRERRFIPLPPMNQPGTFHFVHELEYQFEEGALVTWSIALAATSPMFISSVKITEYKDTALEEAKEEIDQAMKDMEQAAENRYVEFNSSLAGITYTVGENKRVTDEAISDLRTTVNVSAEGLRVEINRVDKKHDGNVVTLNTSINAVAGQVSLKADSTIVNNLGTRVTSAEFNINGLTGQISTKVSQSDFNGNNIVSQINQTAYSVTIDAARINLNGAVVVNGSISGATDINVYRDITVGNNIYLAPSGGGSKSIIFDGAARIVGDWSNIRVSAPNINLDASSVTIGNGNGSVSFNGNVNFAYANVTGLVKAESSGLGLSTSGGYLYVKVNGSTIGSVKLA